MKNYKLLIFDCDGTLIDSNAAIIESIKATAYDLKLTPPTNETILSKMGLSLSELFDEIYPDKAINHADCAAYFYKHTAHYDGKIQLFDGVYDTLQYLHQKNYILAIATNKIRPRLLPTLIELKLENIFSTMRCGDDKFVKPNPKVLLSLLNELSIQPQDALMIGDSKYDMITARGANVDAIAVCYGAHDSQNLSIYNPIACVDHFADLQKLL